MITMTKQALFSERTRIKSNLHLICSLKQLTMFYIYLVTFLLNVTLLNADNSAKCSVMWISGKQTAKCAGQGYISVPSGLNNNIHVFRLENNNLQLLPARVFHERGLVNLQKIFLSNCTIGIINQDAFYKLANLIELDLSRNLLTDVPSHSFYNLTSIRRLLLSYNPISTVKNDSFVHLSKLEYLDLSYCQINLVEANAFQSLTSLKWLKLNNNKITTLSLNALSDISLYIIYLENNPWVCDCELRDLRTWILNTTVHLNEKPICKSPSKSEGKSWFNIDLDELACPPKSLQTDTELNARIDCNVTLVCRIKSSPKPEIIWHVEEAANLTSNNSLLNQAYSTKSYLNSLSAYNNNEERYIITENQQENDFFISIFVLMNFQLEDAFKKYICTAKNSAGFTQENFTINVFTAHSAFWNSWTNFFTTGILMIILSFLFLIILITLFTIRYHRYKNQNENNSSASSDNKSHIENVLKNVKATFNSNTNNHNNNKNTNTNQNNIISNSNNNLNKQKSDNNKLKKMESNNNDLLNNQKTKLSENASGIYVSDFNIKANLNGCDLGKKVSLNNVNNLSVYGNTTGNNILDSSGITLLNNEVVAVSGEMLINQNSINVYDEMMNANQEYTLETPSVNTMNVTPQYGSAYLQPSVNHLVSYPNSNIIDTNNSSYMHLTSNEQLLNSYNNYENMYMPYNQNIMDIQQSQYLLANNYGNFTTENKQPIHQQTSSISINPGDENIYYQNTLNKRASPLISNNLSHNVLSYNGNNVLTNQEMSIYATLQQPNHHLLMQQAANNNQHHVNILGQGSYNMAAQPTVVRYSPDEGYAEETANSNFTLEGTEV